MNEIDYQHLSKALNLLHNKILMSGNTVEDLRVLTNAEDVLRDDENSQSTKERS